MNVLAIQRSPNALPIPSTSEVPACTADTRRAFPAPLGLSREELREIVMDLIG
jgi:hypothetical protein